MRSFKIVQQLQKNQTGEITNANKRKYGKLIKAVNPLSLIDGPEEEDSDAVFNAKKTMY